MEVTITIACNVYSMIEMKQPFYSIAAAIIFATWGLIHGIRSVQQWNLQVGSWDMPIWFSFAIAGLMFVMAYFSLAHMRHK
jgi:hypothetical protein